MASLAKTIIYLILIAFPFGQLFRLDLFGYSFPLIDPLIIALGIVNFLYHRQHHLPAQNRAFAIFCLFSVINSLIHYFFFRLGTLATSLYLARLLALVSLLIYPVSRHLDQKLNRFTGLVLVTCVGFGLIQYFLWPDFTTFSALNWDPHLNRIVGSFLDPTFTALTYLMFFIRLFFSLPQNRLLLVICYLAISLTYSRSTLLSLIFFSVFVSLKTHKPKISLYALVIVTATIFLLPRPPGEGTKLERTSTIKAKLVNYQEGLSLFFRSPLIGHGYNNISQVRQITNPSSHANNGFDGSLLTILVTSGIIGGYFFILGLGHELKHPNLAYQSILIAVLTHSLFANSLLYPWVFFLVAVSKSRKSE